MSESQGGRGGLWEESGPRDLRLVERAIRHGWAVPQATRKRTVRRMDKILKAPESTSREIAAVTKVLLMASRVSLEGVKTTIKAQDHEDLCRRVAKMEHHDKMEDQARAVAIGSSV
jgi:hypothetical protein